MGLSASASLVVYRFGNCRLAVCMVGTGTGPQSWKEVGKRPKTLDWQLPLHKHVLTPDNGTVSRVSRLFLMPTDLILSDRPTDTELGPLAEIADRASEFIQQSKSKNTIRAYRADWTHFESWCQSHRQSSLPATADTVALYVADLAATLKPATDRKSTRLNSSHLGI